MLQKEDGMRIICKQTDADRESVERKRVGVARSVGDAEVSSKMILVPFRNRLPNKSLKLAQRNSEPGMRSFHKSKEMKGNHAINPEEIGRTKKTELMV